MSGFWNNIGLSATVDWCEANYQVSYYVAEWYNTISSLAIFCRGIIRDLLVFKALQKIQTTSVFNGIFCDGPGGAWFNCVSWYFD